MFQIFDAHCDVLYQIWNKKDPALFFKHTQELHARLERLRAGGVKVQTMAIFVPPEVPAERKTVAALEMLDMFHDEILAKDEHIHLLQRRQSLEQLQKNNDLYVLLSMEGAEPLQNDLTYLRTFYRLGLRSVGLTWNGRNLAADGVGEPNPGGLSRFGLALIEEMNRLGMAIDIAHLAEKGFWDCVQHSLQPIMASHCNARTICEHPRNLSDEQIKAIFDQQGFIGVNFVPYFLSRKQTVTTDDVLKHVEHMLSLGGEDYVGFGSDFDGITETVQGLEHAGKWPHLINAFQNKYSETLVEKLFFANGANYLTRLWRDFPE